jgi:hypothetical protein
MFSSSTTVLSSFIFAVLLIVVQADVFVANDDYGDSDIEVDLNDSDSGIFGVRPINYGNRGPAFINLANGGFIHVAPGPGSSGFVGVNMANNGPLSRYQYLNHQRPLQRSWKLRYGGPVDVTSVHIPAGRLPPGYAGTVYTYSSATNDAKYYLIPKITVPSG